MRSAISRLSRKGEDAGDPPPPLRHQRRDGHRVALIGVDEAARASTRMPACLAGRCGRQRNRSRSPGSALADRLFAAMPPRRRRAAVSRRRPRPSPARRRRAVPAPRRRPRARRRAPGRGSRSRRPCARPGAGRACRSSVSASATIAASRARSWHQRPAVEHAAVDDIAIGGVVARQMRKAAEIQRVGELRLAGGEALVAAGHDA